jgi:hydrogenase/urease accessory protein HupE
VNTSNALGLVAARHRRRIWLLIAVMWMSVCASSVGAHPLAPALLELKEDAAGRVEILWKRSSLSTPSSQIHPIAPEDCLPLSQPRLEKEGVALLQRWSIDCGSEGLVGRPIRIEGLGAAGIDTLVRIELSDGRQIQRVLRRSQPSMLVPARANRTTVFLDYLSIGFEHILSGADHLLFVFGLYLLCATTGALVKTITAFTVGHSLTLSLAALGYSNLPSGPIEILIAASVLALAVELARDAPKGSLMRSYPWPMSLGFGLLHGMGFAGALREVGLPSGEIPMALFSFNVGIELGQLVFVTAVLAIAPLLRRLPMPMPQRAAVYVMGSFAAFWVLERSLAAL